MTPAERIAAAEAWLQKQGHMTPEGDGWGWEFEMKPEASATLALIRDLAADVALDASCPKDERVVLDRTGDIDRLVRLGEVVTKIRAAMEKSAAYAEVTADDDYSVAGAVSHGEATALRWVLSLFEDGPDE